MDLNHKKDSEKALSLLIIKDKDSFFLSYRLKFDCTNNLVEYEDLLEGLKKSIDMEVKKLKVLGDFEIIIKQIKNTIHYNSLHPKAYQNEMQDLMNHFEDFNISSIPRGENREVDYLATTSSRISSLENFEMSIFYVQIMFRPSILDNITTWRVFENDSQIIEF